MTGLLVLLLVSVGFISAFINNTAAVAVLLPVVLRVADERRISASKLLIPLSYASQFGGVCTLIGTSTNLLVSAIAERAGVGAFSMFELTGVGRIMFVAGSAYLLFVGRRLLPARRPEELTEVYHLGDYVTEIRIMPNSPFVGKSVLAAGLADQYDITVLELLRGKAKSHYPLQEPLHADDILLIRGPVRKLMEMRAQTHFEIEPEFRLRDATLEDADSVLVEALVAPRSRWIGRTLAELDFRARFNALVLAMQRRGRFITSKLAAVRLRFADAMLLLGKRSDIQRLRQNENVIILSEVQPPAPRRKRALAALLILTAVVAVAALNVFPIVVTAIAGCVAMALARCLSLEEAYEAVDWRVIVLLAGLLPLGTALEKSGAAKWISEQTLRGIGDAGPLAALAVVYLLTTVLTEFMSNNASAVLLAPIAISLAHELGANPKPFLIAVTIAASSSFATPVGYQTNTMVYGAGGYRFIDFVKVGVPLNLLFGVLAVYLIPKFWSF